jgi:sugar O-acyltransferase (sialic acid O-acetyltransferase NeuD family)
MPARRRARLVIVGGGGFGHEVASWAKDCHAAGTQVAVEGYLDESDRGPLSSGAPYLGTITDYTPHPRDTLLLAVGAPDTKRRLVELLRPRGAQFATLIHPTAIIGTNCHHDEGVIICPLAMNTARTYMGAFTTLLSFSGLGHDASLGTYSTVSSHVDIMGHAAVGESVFIGSGARVMPGIAVGNGARIGANVVAQRNVPSGVTLFALPAKSLKMPRGAD